MITTRQVQLALIARGYDVGPDGADGEAGAKTKAALARFQIDNGLEDTGRVDEYTLVRLFPEVYAPKERKTVMNNIIGSVFSGLLKNLLNWQLVQGYLRSMLLGVSGLLVANGLINEEQQLTIVGAALALLGVIFQVLSDNTKAKAVEVVKAVDEAPNVTVIPAEETVSGKPKVVAVPPVQK